MLALYQVLRSKTTIGYLSVILAKRTLQRVPCPEYMLPHGGLADAMHRCDLLSGETADRDELETRSLHCRELLHGASCSSSVESREERFVDRRGRGWSNDTRPPQAEQPLAAPGA